MSMWSSPTSASTLGLLAPEAITVASGRDEIAHVPALSHHRGLAQSDLILRWNDMHNAADVDVVVHFHGYSGHERDADKMSIRAEIEPICGLNFSNPDDSSDATAGRQRPTLGILPRGNFFGGQTQRGYNFTGLRTPRAVRELIGLSLEHFGRHVGQPAPRQARLILTAHSGGGAALLRVVEGLDPDEVHVFDGLYQEPSALIAWARQRISRDRALLAADGNRVGDPVRLLHERGAALRVFFRPRTGTQPHSMTLHRTLCAALPTRGIEAFAARTYRVEQTSLEHPDIPRRYGWRLLADAAADVPHATRVACGTDAPAAHRPAAPHEQVAPVNLAGFSPAEEKALRVTTTFENDRAMEFGGLTGDSDDKGLSFGLLQWNIGSESLQPFLRRFDREHHERIDAIFGPDAAQLRQMLHQSTAQQLAWARSINDAAKNIIQPWARYFGRLAADPEAQRLQLALVRPRMDQAIMFAHHFGLRTERGLALVFDLVTQQGGDWLNTRGCHTCRVQNRAERIEQRVREHLPPGTLPSERELLEIIAHAVSETSKVKYQGDVLRRKMTIATGRGRVHGHDYDLARDFGLTEAAWSIAAAPPPAPAPGPVAAARAYGHAYTPVRGPFRCAAPVPGVVTPATLLPDPAPDDPQATTLHAALAGFGMDGAAIGRLEAAGGFDGLRPIAAFFGAPALQELLARLSYRPADLLAPPHSYGSERDLRARLGVRGRGAILPARLLLVIPGHFRELARRAPDAQEAYALECLGWLVMSSLQVAVRSASGIDWWIPPPPDFVSAFPNPLPRLSPEVQRLVVGSQLIDTTLSHADYLARFHGWDTGLPCRAWRLETGQLADPGGPGLPFYTALVQLPPSVNVATQRAQIDQIWRRRLADTDLHFPHDVGKRTKALTTDDMTYLDPTNLLHMASIGGLRLTANYPALAGVPLVRRVRVLDAIRPVVELMLQTVHDLGWNDLVFETGGGAVFRGRRQPPQPANPMHHHMLARVISNHGYGLAIDFNTFENTQDRARPNGSIDPRIVALIEAFSFQWGGCFGTPDPMHFEYCGAGC